MPKLGEVCRHVRSKNAGPFWITLDLSFPDAAAFQRYAHAPQLQPAAIQEYRNCAVAKRIEQVHGRGPEALEQYARDGRRLEHLAHRRVPVPRTVGRRTVHGPRPQTLYSSAGLPPAKCATPHFATSRL